jgi:hypothetical protein
MQRKNYFVLISLLIILGTGVSIFNIGCRKDLFNTDPSFQLSFSRDTVIFDTVFTTIGSVTKPLLVHNSSNRKVNIGSVRLARGSSSPFRINIDGVSAFVVKDLEIAANDSAYIFVKVTIDPKNQNNPLIETDSIVFETNGNIQDVKLVAWGQDAHFFNNVALSGNVTFTNEKPYVIYGNLVVDSLSDLTIDAGAKLYFHYNSGLLIRNGASIRVNGSLDEPVIFRADRLGVDYSEVPGEWLGIEIEGQSTGNQFTYADIQNGHVGIQLDKSTVGNEPRLILYNTIINNMVNYGIHSIQSNLLALNCQVTNCGGYTIAIKGGKSEFRHCTLANYWYSSGRRYASMLISNEFIDDSARVTPMPLLGAYFGNCIISGNGYDEIELEKSPDSPFNFMFDQCLVQTDQAAAYPGSFLNCKLNDDPKFIDPSRGYYELDTLSPAKDYGSRSIVEQSQHAGLSINHDLKDRDRMSDNGPDLGVYERQEQK